MSANRQTAANFFSMPLDSLSGVGEKRLQLLFNLGLKTVGDLIYFFPRRYEDRRGITPIAKLKEGDRAVIFASVESVKTRRAAGWGKSMATAKLRDETGGITAFWFNRRGIEHVLKERTTAVFYGGIVRYSNALQLSNPEFEPTSSPQSSSVAGIVPVYPSTAGMKAGWFKKLIFAALDEALPLIKETLPQELIKKRGLMPLSNAIFALHRPKDEEEYGRARVRLAYEELLNAQLSFALRRAELEKCRASAKLTPNGKHLTAFLNSLPYDLTISQKKALEDIFADCSGEAPMFRLLQGDVGFGKTFVAIALASAACDAGAQTAVMAPTEVLASQLYAETKKYLEPLGIKVALLKGGQKQSERARIISDLASGATDIVVGTQALVFGSVSFKNLGVVIIDEQHRFGVGQRLALVKQGKAPHLLMMTATPIPRTLAMTLFADLDISSLTDRPPGRKAVETRMINFKKIGVLLQFIIDETTKGGKVFWICPRVEQNENPELSSAKERFEFLRKHLGRLGVALLHGGMSGEEKERAIEAFKKGECKILVSTTVVEVGVNVPEASVIVIEAPERFGLAQLHQLRGRVGRGERRGVCALLSTGLKDEAYDRLKILLETNDGFKIAEADLELRGSGEFTGAAQHGYTEFKVADLKRDIKLLKDAKEDAQRLAKKRRLSPRSEKFIENS